MYRLLIACTCAVLFVTAGCEKEIEQTEATVAGSWEAPFADVVATISLASEGYYAIETSPDGTAGSQLFVVGAWGKIPPYGEWRLGEDEITFMVDGATVGGVEIVELYPDRMLLKASDGSPMYFDRVAMRAVPIPPSETESGDGEDVALEGDDAE